MTQLNMTVAEFREIVERRVEELDDLIAQEPDDSLHRRMLLAGKFEILNLAIQITDNAR